MADYTRIQNDTGRPLRDTLKTDGSADNLSGATVRFTMWNRAEGTVKVDKNESDVTVESAADGEVKYDFQSGDLDTVGTFYFEWEVEFSDGTTITYRRQDGSPKTLYIQPEGS